MLLRLFLLFALCTGAAVAAPQPLDPDEAFRPELVQVDASRLEVRLRIAKGYYLYRHRLAFQAASPGLALGAAEIPPGTPKQDEFFGAVEIFRDQLSVGLPVVSGTAENATVSVSYQGCADIGVCYPPATQELSLGGLNALFPAARSTGASPAPADAVAAPVAELPRAPGGDDSGRLAALLTGGALAPILLAFFGAGLLLAFTPCMLPMLPILTGIIMGRGAVHTSRGRALALSATYVLGMALTYAAAGVAAGLSGGVLLTAALQNPWVLGAFGAVFVVLALSMFGFFELQLPGALQSRLSDLANRQSGGAFAGVAIMGALSALIVGPCMAAPLAGALLYIVQSGDATLGGAALFVMALGMGTPLIVAAGAAHAVLPKVGPWMEAVRRSFGVMLLGVALWLVTPVIPPAAVMLGWAALLVVPAIFLHALDPLPAHSTAAHRFWKGVGVLALLYGVALFAGALAGSRDPLQPLGFLRASAAERPLPFEAVGSVAELDRRLAEGRPVMLDFYADWCVSCKEMERFTFSDPAVRASLAGTLLLKADVTAQTAEHQALLKRFNLFGPPGIVFFDTQGRELPDLRVVGYLPADRFQAVLTRRAL